MRKIHFCYGHRVMGHRSKCATLHGHNGYLDIHASPIKSLNELGMVIDFSLIKEKVGGWVEEHWDHTMILGEQDIETIQAVNSAPGNKKPFILPTNPTAENLAHFMLWEVCPNVLKGNGIVVHKVELWETDNCSASVEEPVDSPELLSLYS